jgi:hypothetical protein
MKMKKTLSILILAFIAMSCEKEIENCCTVIDIDLVVKIVDSNGESLLDESNGIDSNTIRLFYKENNEWAEIKGHHPRVAKGMKVEENSNSQKQLSIYISTDYVDHNNITEMKLQFSESDFEIIKGEIDYSHGNTICTKVWCQDQLVYEQYVNDERIIELLK